MVVNKSKSAFRTIAEVAEELGVATHVLRFWETKFPQIKPMKRSGGRRYYRPDDVNLLKQLLRKKVGISLLSEIAITKEDKDLIVIPMVKDERLTLYISLITLKENNLHPKVLNFLKELFS